MTLWTIHNMDWYDALLKHGIIHGNKKYIDNNWNFSLFGYEWMIKKMEKRIGKRPFPDCYPIWAWYQYSGSKKRKPDLRRIGLLPTRTKGVRLEINKREEDVLLSDFMLWHFPFGFQSFIGKNEEESVAFETMLEEKRLDRKRLEELPENIQNKIIKSWDRVLDMNFQDPYHTQPKDNKAIQATFWSLKVEEIVKADEFIAR